MVDSHPTSILGTWYGNPQEEGEATRILELAQKRKQAHLRHGHSSICCNIQIMIARFWLGESIAKDLQGLQQQTSATGHGQVLLHLIHGQLLMSRRLDGAMDSLNRGFTEGRLLFTPDDYFLVLKRHQTLSHLPLGNSPLPAEPLESLLNSARVIQLLERSEGRPSEYSHDHRDTFD